MLWELWAELTFSLVDRYIYWWQIKETITLSVFNAVFILFNYITGTPLNGFFNDGGEAKISHRCSAGLKSGDSESHHFTDTDKTLCD